MLLNKQEITELEMEIEKCVEKLETLRKTKIRHYVQETVFNRFGCQIDNVGVLMDKNGTRYVLDDLESQIEYNYANQRYYGCMVLIIGRTITKTNGTLSKLHKIIYDLKTLDRTGEQYYG